MKLRLAALIAAAVAALMAFAGGASATTITSPTGTTQYDDDFAHE